MKSTELSAPFCLYVLERNDSRLALHRTMAATIFWLLNEGYLTLSEDASAGRQLLYLRRTAKIVPVDPFCADTLYASPARAALQEFGLEAEGSVFCMTISTKLYMQAKCLAEYAKCILDSNGALRPKPRQWERWLTWLPLVVGVASCLMFVRPIWLAIICLLLGCTAYFKIVVRNLPAYRRFRSARSAVLDKLRALQTSFKSGEISATDFLPYDAVFTATEREDQTPKTLLDDAWAAKPEWFVGDWPEDSQAARGYASYIFKWLEGRCWRTQGNDTERIDPMDVLEVYDGTLGKIGRVFGIDD